MSDPDRWRRVEQLFHEALERPDGERTAWLDAACAGDSALHRDVASLLESDRAAAGAFIGSQVQHAVIALGDELRPKTEGRRLGPYRLIRELGHGGMGAVYLAARDDQEYESEVAIKIVRPGLDSDFVMHRFRRERQILARLHHPNIAGLFDGGTTEDGSPYIVMEYIDGSWITKYVEQHTLSIEERLRLFLPVCAAVEHAHRHFIVHRDLKPGNILIDASGAPKLLDFGVSKLLVTQPEADETQELGMMTPDYASPEQISGEPVTVTSDVYSLGAVLYELLTGVRPHRIDRRTAMAIERAICQDNTIPPSVAVKQDRARSRRLAGDLDNIVLRAMHKQREQRYQSVEQLAADIRRHLDHQPVVARPDSLAYRTRKFVRRNRVAVALGTLVVTSLAVGTTVAVREARIAEDRFGDVRTLATKFVFDVEQVAREMPGSLRVRQMIAQTGLQYLDRLARSSSNDQALQRELATAYLRIGEVQGGVETSNLGDTPGALTSFAHAATLLDSVLSHAPDDRQATMDRMLVIHRQADMERERGRLTQSLALLEDGTRRGDAFLARHPHDPDALQYAGVMYLDAARVRQLRGDLQGAAQSLSTGISHVRELSTLRPDDREALVNLSGSQARLGNLQSELARPREALESYRGGATILEQLIARYPTDTKIRQSLMLAYAHVGDTLGNPSYDNLGDTTGALTAYRKMLEIAGVLRDADRSDVRAEGDYGIALLRVAVVSPMPDKRALLEESLERLQSTAARNSKDKVSAGHRAWAAVELGDVLRAAGDRVAAARAYARGLGTAQAVQALDPDDALSSRWLVLAAGGLAREQIDAGDPSAAIATVDHAIKLGKRLEATLPPNAAGLRSNVARAWQQAGMVYTVLANHEHGEASVRSRQMAHDWYQRSMAEWKRLETLEGFNERLRRLMATTAAEFAALDKRDARQ